MRRLPSPHRDAARGSETLCTRQRTSSPVTSAMARSDESNSRGRTGTCAAVVENGLISKCNGYASTGDALRVTAQMRQISVDALWLTIRKPYNATPVRRS